MVIKGQCRAFDEDIEHSCSLYIRPNTQPQYPYALAKRIGAGVERYANEVIEIRGRNASLPTTADNNEDTQARGMRQTPIMHIEAASATHGKTPGRTPTTPVPDVAATPRYVPAQAKHTHLKQPNIPKQKHHRREEAQPNPPPHPSPVRHPQHPLHRPP